MFGRILIILLVAPIVELALLLRVGSWIGFWPTVALIAATAVLGSYLVRRQGLAVWRQLQERLGRGDLPGDQIVDGVIILVSGTLLVTPGVLTDVSGILGLLPFVRIPIRKYLMRRFQRSIERGTMSFGFGSFGSMMYESPEADDLNESGWEGTPRDAPGSVDSKQP